MIEVLSVEAKLAEGGEFIYDLPQFSPEEKAEIVASPWEVKSDTFFFAEDKLIIHNRAEYNYAPLDE